MEKIRWFWVLLVFLCVTGCASMNGHLPKHALTDPAEAISIPHSVEWEKLGVKVLTTFTAMMSPDFWVEMVAGGGVFPILGRPKDAKELKDLRKGYCYMADINWWGDYLLQCMFANSKAELDDVQFSIFNRDAGWAYKLDGQEAIELPAEGEDKKPFGYDPSKFESDGKYRNEFFDKFGMTLKQSDEFFISYLKEKGLEPSENLSSVSEIEVGSEKWEEEYKPKLAVRLPFNYKMADGQIRSGHLPLEVFRNIAVVDPGFTSGARFVKGANIPLLALPLTGLAWPVMAGIGALTTTGVAAVKDDWEGYYYRAKVMREQLRPTFRLLHLINKQLLVKHDERIKELEDELRQQRFHSELLLNR